MDWFALDLYARHITSKFVISKWCRNFVKKNPLINNRKSNISNLYYPILAAGASLFGIPLALVLDLHLTSWWREPAGSLNVPCIFPHLRLDLDLTC